ncbi:MAG: hypothetical protein ACP6IP_09905 [Candidatus Njordarchaeia archaeon]
MQLNIYFSLIYIILAIVAFILAGKFWTIYVDFPIPAFKQYIYLVTSIGLFSVVYTLNYFTDVKFSFGMERIYLMDTMMTLLALITVFIFFNLMENATGVGYSWRMLVFTFALGGSFVGELTEIGLFSYIVSGGIEIFGILFFLAVFGLNLREVKRLVAYPKYYNYNIIGLLLMILGVIQGTLFGLLNVFNKSLVIVVFAETWGVEFIVGMLLILYAALNRPLSIISIVAEPTALVMISNEGEILYNYFFKKSMDKLKRKRVLDMISGLFLEVKDIKENESILEEIKTSSFSIIGKTGKYVTGLFIVGKKTGISYQLISLVTEIFDQEVGQKVKEGKLEEINIEELGRFDHIVKYYLDQVAR